MFRTMQSTPGVGTAVPGGALGSVMSLTYHAPPFDRTVPGSDLIAGLSRFLNALVDSSTLFLRGPPVLAYFTPLPATHLIAAKPYQQHAVQ